MRSGDGIRCEQVETEISALLDGELSGDRQAPVEAHLASCAGCRRKHRLLAATRDAFRGLDAESAPAGFEQMLSDRLAAEQLPARQRGARRWLPAFALAAAVAVASLALSLLSPGERPAVRSAPAPRWQEPDRAMLETGLRLPPFGGTAVPICGLADGTECRPVLPCSTAAECSPALDAVGVALMSM